MKEADFKLSI